MAVPELHRPCAMQPSMRGRIVGGSCREAIHQRQCRSRSLADAAVGLATATMDAITEVYRRGRATPAITRDEFTEPAPQLAHDPRPMLSAIYPRGSVCAVVLGGGEADSRRLFPLTEKRTLPAIPLAGSYRLIDVPLSNLVNSGIHKVFVLTQYNSTSLNKYIQRTYDWHGTVPLGGDGGAFMEVVAATQNPREQRWADGAADAVRQWWNMFHGNPLERFIEDILILPSDHVYRMDFENLVEFHRHSLADLTLVCRPVEERLVDHFGIVKLGAHSTSIQTFEEKPQSEERKALMSMDFDDVQEFVNDQYAHSIPFLDDVNTIDHKSPQGKSWIASCGIMLFRKEALDALLKGNKQDFGRELIPDAISAGMKVVAFNHPGYWADIGGSIADYHDFNVSLAKGQIPFAFDGTAAHEPFIRSWANLPPNSIQGCHLKDVLLSSGCRLEGSTIRGSIIGNRTIIGNGCVIEDSNIMGADYYEWEKDFKRQVGPQYPHIGIGENCIIKKTIVDKNARIGNNVQLLNKEGVFESMDRLSKGVAIRDNVIIVTKSAVLPDGTQV